MDPVTGPMSTRAGVRVDVLVAAHNAGCWLAETLDSLLAQTMTDWCCLVLDDGSADDAITLARSFAGRDDRVVVRSQAIGSVSTAQTGFSMRLQLPVRLGHSRIATSNGYCHFADRFRGQASAALRERHPRLLAVNAAPAALHLVRSRVHRPPKPGRQSMSTVAATHSIRCVG